MPTDDRVDVYYPLWCQLLSWLGVPMLTLIGVWLVTMPAWAERIAWHQFGAGLAMGAGVLYQCAIGMRALPYMRVRMAATLQGLEVVSGGQHRTIAWSEFAMPKYYPFAQTIHLFLRTGETIAYVFDNMTNIGVVKALIQEHHDGSR